MQLLPPLRFRLHEDDHEQYGADWYLYDEAAIMRLPVGELRDIERAVGMSLIEVMNRGRQGFVDGTLAQMWVARHLAGVVEPFADFAPLVMLADWEPIRRRAAVDADPPEASGPSSPQAARKRSSAGTSRSSRSSRTSPRKA